MDTEKSCDQSYPVYESASRPVPTTNRHSTRLGRMTQFFEFSCVDNNAGTVSNSICRTSSKEHYAT